MGEVRIFPVSRSRAHVERTAAIVAIDDDERRVSAWQKLHLELCEALLDQGVPDERVDLELLKLFRNAESLVDRRRKGRTRDRERRRLHLVPPAQLDLFVPKADVEISDLDTAAATRGEA